MTKLEDLTISKPAPEIDEQIKWIATVMTELKEKITETSSHLQNMQEDLRFHQVVLLENLQVDLQFQQAIYQTLLISKWVIELCTADILNMPGNQPSKQTKCWIPFYLKNRRWTIILVERGTTGHKKHELGDVATEAEAIDWADNENFSQFGIEDRVAVASILAGTVFEKEVSNG